MRKVEVRPYDPKWSSLFLEEASKLRKIFGDLLVDIHHFGSTAVQGLQAKPIIDIMPIVKDIQKVDQFNEKMESLGYVPKGENGIPGRRYFKKGGDERTHHVHVYQIGSNEITRHLVFRDYLRANPIVRDQYGELKAQLALQFPYDIDSYIEGKDKFATEIERQALEWYRKKSES